ncbi:MAG: hypothetical protein NTU85_00160 [Candidatus Kaiserbacteria bacterium]|nr:hypothetical protein [Candidatus Kaiserbacteria bacterium]
MARKKHRKSGKRNKRGKPHENKRVRTCQTKVRHSIKDRAEKHANDLNRKKGNGSEVWTVYFCSFCDGWHVGRPKKKKQTLIIIKNLAKAKELQATI